MKKTWKKHLRSIVCILLCIAMLPVVNVSAGSYLGVYYTLVDWSRQNERYIMEDPDWGEMTVSAQSIWIGDEYFEVYVQDYSNPAFTDFMIIDYEETKSQNSYHQVIMHLSPEIIGEVSFTWFSNSDNTETGAPDQYGNYRGYANSYLDVNATLGSFEVYGCDATVAESRVQEDFRRAVRRLLEKLDSLLRGLGDQSVQDIFPNMSPKEYHTVTDSWVSQSETCTADGLRSYYCGSCGTVFGEPIPAHHNWVQSSTDVSPTDVHGSGQFRCITCGQTKTDALCIGSVFADMPAFDNWAHPGIDWAVYNGVTNGTSASTFSPDSTCTRAQVVTFLWRAAGSPEPKSSSTPFTDLQTGAYYEKAVAWAVENQITSGTSAATFSPESTCTRGQIVTFLWRFKGMPEPSGEGTRFIDVAEGTYYEDAVAWAASAGVTAGTSRVVFSPDAKCTRAQVVTFLYRAQGHALEPVEYKDLVGISMPTAELIRWNDDGRRLQSLLTDAGYDVELQFAGNSPSKQISQIEKMIGNGAKVLIVGAIDGDALGPVLDLARSAGCEVIAYDRPISSRSVSYYITFDNFEVGAAQGRFIAERLDLENAGDKFYNIELITGSPDDGNAYVFYEGAMSVLRKYLDNGTLRVRSGQILFRDVATEGWSSENAQNRFENLLRTYYSDSPLHAVMASNDSTAQGVTLALENVYRNSVYPIITGQDCDIVSVRNILSGKQAMSVFKDTTDLSARAAEMAVAILKGETVPVNSKFTTYDGISYPSLLCDPKICTKDNLRQILVDSGYYTEAELNAWAGY